MGKIEVSNIQLYAYHGCMKEEALIGSKYRVDVLLEADLIRAAKTDDLAHTVDYVEVHRIVKEQMSIRAKLLETVAQRIIDQLLQELPLMEKVCVTVRKLTPPIMGNVESVAVTLSNTQKG